MVKKAWILGLLALFFVGIGRLMYGTMSQYQERGIETFPGDFKLTCQGCRYNPQTDELACWCVNKQGTQHPSTLVGASKEKFIKNVNGVLVGE